MILLLSATPYKPFSTLEELTEYNADEHYEDFSRLMDFLFTDENEFHELWSDYSHKLSHLSTDKFDVVLASKQSAENKMYQGMCRTERLNEGLISTDTVTEIPMTQTIFSPTAKCRRLFQHVKKSRGRVLNIAFHGQTCRWSMPSHHLTCFRSWIHMNLNKKFTQSIKASSKGCPNRQAKYF